MNRAIRISWPGFSTKGTLLIPVDRDLFKLSKTALMISDQPFEAKDELHITLIGKKNGSLILDKINRDSALKSSLITSFESIDWSFRKTHETILIGRRKEIIDETGTAQTVHQKSIITRIQMTGMALFYSFLKAVDLIQHDTPVPPPHITLYTRNCPNGIGVRSEDSLQLMTIASLHGKDLIRMLL